MLGANTIQYAYSSALGQWAAICNYAQGAGNGAVQYVSKATILSLWAFSTPFTGTQSGYEIARTDMLHLLLGNPNPPPPDPYMWVGAGMNYLSPSLPPLVTLPNGTWYLTMFFEDV